LPLTDDSVVLDIGSKDGKKANYLINKGSLVMSDIVRRNLSPLVVLDATCLPFKDNSIDLVTMLHVLEHFKDGNLAVEEIYRVLKSNGSVLIVTPNARRLTKIYSMLLRFFGRSQDKYPMNPDHVLEYDASNIEVVMRNSAFKEHVIEPIFMASRFIRIRKYCDQWFIYAKKP